MAQEKQKQGKKGAPSSFKSGSQKNHQAGHRKDPRKILRRIIQSSGFPEAQRWADKFEVQSHLAAIQRGNYWIARKKAEVGARAVSGYVPTRLRVGRALLRHPPKAVATA